jgi:hypothetical protein
MSNECRRPWSSSHAHRNVPTLIFTVRVPPNPFMTRLLSLNSPTKSLLTCDMHPEHRLSTPTHSESVSKYTLRSVARVWVAIARTVSATIVLLFRDRCRLMALITLRRESSRASASSKASQTSAAVEHIRFHRLVATRSHQGGLPLLGLSTLYRVVQITRTMSCNVSIHTFHNISDVLFAIQPINHRVSNCMYVVKVEGSDHNVSFSKLVTDAFGLVHPMSHSSSSSVSDSLVAACCSILAT